MTTHTLKKIFKAGIYLSFFGGVFATVWTDLGLIADDRIKIFMYQNAAHFFLTGIVMLLFLPLIDKLEECLDEQYDKALLRHAEEDAKKGYLSADETQKFFDKVLSRKVATEDFKKGFVSTSTTKVCEENK